MNIVCREPGELTFVEGMGIFPNPVSNGILTVNLYDDGANRVTFKVISADGKSVLEYNYTIDSYVHVDLDLGELSNGVYVLVAETNKSVKSKKFVVQ